MGNLCEAGLAYASFTEDDAVAPRLRNCAENVYQLLPAGLDENGSASFAEDASAYLHADAKRRRLMTAVTDRRAPKCFLWSCG